jgi:hypothetical protein
MNKNTKQRITEAKINYYKTKYTNYPPHLIPKSIYTDTTANGLTKCIKDFLNYSGHQAERISSMGRVINNKKNFTDVMGRTLEVGSSKYIRPTTTAGTADISAIISGRAVKIEIKIGKDRQSDAQKQYEKDVTEAGGVYFIAKDFEQFIDWYDNFIRDL